MSAPDALALAEKLIARESLTPDDKGCQDLVADILVPLGFGHTDLSAEGSPVRNSLYRLGDEAPLLLLAGHTDVVPPGPIRDWRTEPFVPTRVGDYLHGRGASDMKASVAAMTTALAAVAEGHKGHWRGSVALLLTSDEEGTAIDGTRVALEKLKEQGIHIDHCLIGEPTSELACGDTVKIGRRGSLSADLTIKGVQGHIAYPHLANNPIHTGISRLNCLLEEPLDTGYESFEPSSLQFSKILAGIAGNVIPGHLDATFNIRFNPSYSVASLKAEIERRLKKALPAPSRGNSPNPRAIERGGEETVAWRQDDGPGYCILWSKNPSEPFLSPRRNLAESLCQIIQKTTCAEPRMATSGGTSDGRFISQYCDDLVEFGPVNDTIHKANERVSIDEIRLIERIYTELIERTLGLAS